MALREGVRMAGLTYKQALAAPTQRGGCGWAHADGESMRAALAQALGWAFCLSPQSVYDWSLRHNVAVAELRGLRREPADVLLVAVLNDWTAGQARKELAAADNATAQMGRR